MFVTFIRTIIMYFFVIISLRMLGKRQIGELEPSELVVTIVISEVAALPIQDTSQPIISSLLAIALLLVLEMLLSFGAYKNFALRKIFFGTPSVFYEKGKINQKEMARQRFNLNDLMETVRNTGATSLAEVDYVIMETNGNVSVIPKPDFGPATPRDLKIVPASQNFISYVLIDNGHINDNNLRRLGFNREWLTKQLKSRKIPDASHIFCMTADRTGEIVIIKNDTHKERKKR
ncbi:MAG: DUF421 domain-containing protein [Clostridia bacterium]|nr:DUF421 domain-containing protein [Clostridia bacterium]